MKVICITSPAQPILRVILCLSHCLLLTNIENNRLGLWIMAWTSLILSLLALCSGQQPFYTAVGMQQYTSCLWFATDDWISYLFAGASSQAVVTQESALTTSPGGTVILTCRSSTGAVTTSNYANWVQEKPDHLFTGLIGGTSNRAPGVPVRFSGSLIGDKAALTITGAQTEDEAIYFCALWYSNHFHNDMCRWGSRTRTLWYSLITTIFLTGGYMSLVCSLLL